MRDSTIRESPDSAGWDTIAHTMKDGHAKLVERLFQAAADLPPGERGPFLAREIANDPSVLAEVGELLDHLEEASDTFLTSPVLPDLPELHWEVPGLLEEDIPERIGEYPVLGEIGRGGMGVVYRAMDTRPEREIAIKRLMPTAVRTGDWCADFRTEARLLASIHHPNIATIFSLEDEGDQAFLTMELVRGEPLANRIGQGSLPFAEALLICQQIASALEAAHDKKVMHLDLKPLNVMITTDTVVKVLDFGLARSLSAADGGDIRRLPAGTVGYMSPEQIQSGKIGPEADVWAFGCILYECLTGEPAFLGSTVTERLERTLTAEPNWDRLPPELPRRLQILLRQSLHKDPGERLASIRAVRREIEEEIARRARVIAADVAGNADSSLGSSSGTDLPSALTRFIGRSADLEAVAALSSAHRLVTLVGPGGAGKSRLGIESARRVLPRFPHGARFIEFAPITDPRSIESSLLAHLGARDLPGRTPIVGIHEQLEGREQLLVLDNCEHLLSAIAPLVQELLLRHPRLRVLATSREPLGVSGEQIYRVPPMLESAVELFVERATAGKPPFGISDETSREAIVRICERLDGLPLAIELAAARTRVLRPEEILESLDDRFRLLTAGASSSLPRHRTLKALIDWSYEQLEDAERTFFNRLAVFSGGFTLEAAEAVATGDGIEPWEALDLLGRLVDKSLVEMVATPDPGGRARYRMLDTVHAYARRALGPRSAAEAAHRHFFEQEAQEAGEGLTGSTQTEALARIDADLANFEKAVESGLDQIPAAPESLSIVITLLSFGNMRGRWAEMRRLGESVVSRPEVNQEVSANLGHLHHRLGNLARVQGDIAAAVRYFDRAGQIWDELGIHRNQAAILNNKGLIAHSSGDYAGAESLFLRALALNREHGNRDFEATNLNNLGMCANEQGRTGDALAHYEEAARIAREIENEFYLAIFLDNLAIVNGSLERLERACELHEESLTLHRKLGNRRGEATTLLNLASVLRGRGDRDQAYRCVREGLGIKQEIGDARGLAFALESLAVSLSDRGEYRRVVLVLTAALAARESASMPRASVQAEECERYLALAREKMTEEEFATALEEGRRLSPDEAAREGID